MYIYVCNIYNYIYIYLRILESKVTYHLFKQYFASYDVLI